ncbi:hypothetical protein [Hymenobacter cellulosilyticus]|uniref:Uncharacterized protein n=1 Tax=Hymenobacter cellulosilyticus TaxID=2932248 RepID=A0A8T9Q456_9BACT|nr:hypothetical protein [Hymenobacter cellulosilyticus]UOQ70678.1 hypothetical protein MUN79_18480 [Hymenobacter cellulosilyticus]
MYPSFAHDSQVVAGTEERISYYQTWLAESAADGPPLPPEYQLLPGADRLSWTTHRQVEWLDAEDYPAGWPASARRRPHWFHTTPDGNEYLLIQTGWAWVGQLPAPASRTRPSTAP